MSDREEELYSDEEEEEYDEDGNPKVTVDLLDIMEQGLAHEMPSDLLKVPDPKAGGELEEYFFVRSEDKSIVNFYRESDESFQICAFYRNQCWNFSLYEPRDQFFDASRSCFTLRPTGGYTKFVMQNHHCEGCDKSSYSCGHGSQTRQELGSITVTERDCPGAAHLDYFEVVIPSVYADRSRSIWCPRKLLSSANPHSHYALQELKRGKSFSEYLKHSNSSKGSSFLDSPSKVTPIRSNSSVSTACDPFDREYESILLKTNIPKWDAKTEGLVLDFKGRVGAPSVKNFQLIQDSTEEVVFQTGKVEKGEYIVDFSYPLCPLQAFCITLSAQHL
mmetsp:Transcript_33476/g.38027  ORF Transcript_33476/g.38027 Transcript_33476/m.38027 type:complete len:333 (+) Transcript_33476:189-1187(+)